MSAGRAPTRRGALLLGLALLLVAGVGACRRGETAIGVVLPLSGDLAPWGEQARAGIELAFAELPADQRPPLIFADGRGTAPGTHAAFEELVGRGASLVIGPLSTENALAAGLVARALHTPCLSPAATGEEVARDNPWALRFCFSDPDMAESLASFARYDRQLARLAIVKDLGDRWSAGLAESFAQEFLVRRGRIVGEVSYYRGEDDLGRVLDEVVAMGADGAFVAGYHDDLATMLEGARDPGVASLALLGADGWEGTRLGELVPGRVREAFHTAHFAADEPRPDVSAFVSAFTAAEGEPPGDFAALGYDAARAALTVWRADASPASLRDALLALTLFEGVTGTVRMDEAGSPVSKSLVIKQLHDAEAPRFFERRDT